MKVTNKCNLPQAMVDAVSEEYEYKEGRYSCTTILRNVREILLEKRHYNEINVDASDMINKLFGTAIHSYLEKFDKTGGAELKLQAQVIPGYVLSGRVDLYDNGILVDYKTASVWKIIKKDFEDWHKQGLIYAWLLFNNDKPITKVRFHAILKDWTAREARNDSNYPQNQVFTYEFDIGLNDLVEIGKFIKERFNEISDCESLSDDALPECDDTWYTGDKYAVYKNKSDTKATRLFDSQKEACDYLKNKMNGNGLIVYRKGEHRKCQDYCDIKEFCKYGKER